MEDTRSCCSAATGSHAGCHHCHRSRRHRRHTAASSPSRYPSVSYVYDSRFTAPLPYGGAAFGVTAPAVIGSDPAATAAAAQGYYTAAIEALRAENKALRRELRSAKASAKDSQQLREEQLRAVVGCVALRSAHRCVPASPVLLCCCIETIPSQHATSEGNAAKATWQAQVVEVTERWVGLAVAVWFPQRLSPDAVQMRTPRTWRCSGADVLHPSTCHS